MAPLTPYARDMGSKRVLVVGGTGFFGRLLIDDLLGQADCDPIVASRRPLNSGRFKTVVADLHDPGSLSRALDGVTVAICAAGPYQELPTSLVDLCLNRGIHYIDLSDDRSFVRKVVSITSAHKHLVSAVCTGWSTVPALSGLLARIASAGMRSVESIHIQMAPGNRGARQTATIASLLHSVGQSFRVFRSGEWIPVRGWSEPRDFFFPSPIGRRRGYLVDVPDHEVLPETFGAHTVEFRAGSELRALNWCLSLMRLTHRSWAPWTSMFQRSAALLSWIGHDAGALGVEVTGDRKTRACIVATSHGERMAVMPASVMTGLLLSGSADRHVPRGLVSWTNWLTEEQLRSECAKRSFRLSVETL